MQTDAEILEAARRIVANAPPPVRNHGLPQGYHGPIDLSYIRGTDVREFPKMVYKSSKVDPQGYITRIVKSQEEQDALPKGWATTSNEVSAILDPIIKARTISAEENEGTEPEEHEVSKKVKQAAKDKEK